MKTSKQMTQRIPAIKTIEDIVKDVPGWSPTDQLHTLFTLVYASADLPGDVVELGSWCGRSAVALGLAARLTGKTNVHCIDLFPERGDWRRNTDGTYSFSVSIDGKTYGAYEEQTVWEEPYLQAIAPLYETHEGILEIFKETMLRNNLEDVVHPFKGTMRIFLASVPEDFKCKLAFIDGDHGYEAVCDDIKAIEPFLVDGGWLCFDDAFSSYEGINKAIDEMILGSEKYELAQQMTRKFFVAKKKPNKST